MRLIISVTEVTISIRPFYSYNSKNKVKISLLDFKSDILLIAEANSLEKHLIARPKKDLKGTFITKDIKVFIDKASELFEENISASIIKYVSSI